MKQQTKHFASEATKQNPSSRLNPRHDTTRHKGFAVLLLVDHHALRNAPALAVTADPAHPASA